MNTGITLPPNAATSQGDLSPSKAFQLRIGKSSNEEKDQVLRRAEYRGTSRNEERRITPTPFSLGTGLRPDS